MDSAARHTFRKEERLCSRKAIDALFGGGHPSVAAYPLRAVFMPTEDEGVKVLMSVPKRHFKRAVRRNRIKRQLREAYRQQKHLLQPLSGGGLCIAFLWTSPDLLPTAQVFRKMRYLLLRIHDKKTPISSAE